MNLLLHCQIIDTILEKNVTNIVTYKESKDSLTISKVGALVFKTL